MDGLSLVPLLEKPTAKLKRDTLYWHYPHYYATTSPVSSIRQGDWKLLEYLEDKRIELYNLRKDIGEENPPEADSDAHTKPLGFIEDEAGLSLSKLVSKLEAGIPRLEFPGRASIRVPARREQP